MKSSACSNQLVRQILEKYNNLSQNKTTIFCWISGHVGIRGNENADIAAKDSLKLTLSNMKIPSSDFKPIIRNVIKTKWQTIWDNVTENKLQRIKPTLGKPVENILCRKDQAVLTRCRIGHTRITHSYLVKKKIADRSVTPASVHLQFVIFYQNVHYSKPLGRNFLIIHTLL